MKPPENGVGAGTVVARRETVVEWAAPQIGLTVNAPTAAGAGGTFPVTVMLDNAGAVESKDARVKVTLSDGATLASSEPPPARQEAGGVLVFDLPPVSGKAKQEVDAAGEAGAARAGDRDRRGGHRRRLAGDEQGHDADRAGEAAPRA